MCFGDGTSETVVAWNEVLGSPRSGPITPGADTDMFTRLQDLEDRYGAQEEEDEGTTGYSTAEGNVSKWSLQGTVRRLSSLLWNLASQYNQSLDQLNLLKSRVLSLENVTTDISSRVQRFNTTTVLATTLKEEVLRVGGGLVEENER
ncbi:hypothetical protein Pcinc_031985 [Petrolisthes cinctipes]|uniref:Uncharacterized protein n=1 Tax=Petrolisthes cinctipes TaxID=88211 RepID=A0AAE1EV92_PETCI|nr:hypothetical protein Pcinc_031985 [Petrolisthes cinctipes]